MGVPRRRSSSSARPVALLAAGALAHAVASRERERDLVGLLEQKPGGDQKRRRLAHRARRARAAAAQQVRGDRPARWDRVDAQVELAHRRSRRRWRARSRARRDGLPLVVDRARPAEAEPRGGDREHARAGPEVEQRPAASPLARELDEQLEAAAASSRARRCRTPAPARSRSRSGSRRRRLVPGRPDAQRVRDLDRVVVGPPALGPVVGDLAGRHLDERVADAGLERRSVGSSPSAP